MELPVYRSLTHAMTAGRLRTSPAAGALQPFIVEPSLPDDAAAVFERTAAGACVFLDQPSNLCIVHRDLGEPALPATCRHFPRLAVRDLRGTFVTLSHFCPTAASMLFRDDVALEVVCGPPAFPPRDYDGLSVSADDLPPLLHPRMLMDYEGYAAWESHMVRRCAQLDLAPESVLATLLCDARRVREWKPGRGALASLIRGLGGEAVPAEAHRTLAPSLALRAAAMRAVPPEFMPEPDDDGLEEAFGRHVRPAWQEFCAPLNRYLAGKSFASWTAYQGRGILSIVRGLECALGLVRVEAARQCRDASRRLDRDLLLEAFRSADFILNHLAVGEDLASEWSVCETP